MNHKICQEKYAQFKGDVVNGVYCNAIFDTFLCWPPTLAGTTAQQHCPPVKLSDVSKFALRRCDNSGHWAGRYGNESGNSVGWTNYTPCHSPEMQYLISKLYSSESANMILETARQTRYLEIVGFSISLIALLMSLVIFCYFRSLRNKRTRIHKNLFMAMVIQVMIRLTLYIDQAVIRSNNNDLMDTNSSTKGIDNTMYLCEASYIMLEYARTAMFMWMFIEGLYLHNMVTVSVFQENISYKFYFILGWGAPVLMTTIWAVLTAICFGKNSSCWWGYNFSSYYWILEGPRLGVILLNFVFLMNIIRVLIMKLRQSQTSEIEQVRHWTKLNKKPRDHPSAFYLLATRHWKKPVQKQA